MAVASFRSTVVHTLLITTQRPQVAVHMFSRRATKRPTLPCTPSPRTATKRSYKFFTIRLTLKRANFRQIPPQHVHALQSGAAGRQNFPHRGQFIGGCCSLLPELFSRCAEGRMIFLASTICSSNSLSNVASMRCFRLPPIHVANSPCHVCRQRCRCIVISLVCVPNLVRDLSLHRFGHPPTNASRTESPTIRSTKSTAAHAQTSV